MIRVFAFGLAAIAVASLLGGGAATAARDGQRLDWRSLSLVDIAGVPLDPATFEGRVVLVVNTASRCAFTPQYDGLEALWDRYRGRGLVVLGVPSNDFGNQEPGSNEDIARFCQSTFGVSFPMTGKASVIGPNAHPVFRWAREVGGRAAVPGWNFHKLLIDRDGRLVGTFTSYQRPDTPEVTTAVERALAAAPGS